jgi:hypothetical protein
MKAANIFYSIASGPKARRRRLMPVGLLIGIAWVVSPVVAARTSPGDR